MKKLLAIAVLSSSLAHAQPPPYPAGIWTGLLVDGPNLIVYDTTLYILPNGQFWGTVDKGFIGGAGAHCPVLIWGNLVKGGTGATSASGPTLECSTQPSAWGSSTITLTSRTAAKWSVNNPLLKNVFSLTLSSSLYDQPSSFKAIAGYWNSQQTGYTEIVTPTGASMSYNPILGCIGNGQYTIVDATHNLYSFTETLYDCDSAFFNGTRNGVAYIYKYGGPTSLARQTSAQRNAGITNIVEDSGGLLYYGH